MYPIIFCKHFVEKVWGGRDFERVLGMDLPPNQAIGEAWEISSHKNGISLVQNGPFQGKNLEELIEEFGEELLGKEVVERFHRKFPLLIKYLDIHDRLSVQVHPSDEYSLRVEKEFGKSECWYIMEASKDAKMILGLQKGVDKEIFFEKTKQQDFSNLFREVQVEQGDFINISPGIVHASLQGSILLCEIQQNSDTTYRIFDFDRVVDEKKRELHLEKAMDVIDFEATPFVSKEKERKSISKGACKVQELLRGNYFNVDKLQIQGEFQDEIHKNFKIYSIVDGKGVLKFQGEEYPAKKGDSYLIPANLEVLLVGELEILKSFL